MRRISNFWRSLKKTNLINYNFFFNNKPKACTEDYGCVNNCVCNLGNCAYYFANDNGIEADNSDSCLSGYIENGLCTAGRVSDIKGRTCSVKKKKIIFYFFY